MDKVPPEMPTTANSIGACLDLDIVSHSLRIVLVLKREKDEILSPGKVAETREEGKRR